MNARLLRRIALLEERAARNRVKAKKTVIGSDRLVAQPLDLSYRPRRSGRRMWCLSEKRAVRVAFIEFFRNLMARARTVRERWRSGETWLRYPPGLFPPTMPKLANVLAA
jgi:hypothetical protein